ncbi:hypothetical protein Ade02nite_42320 [Paractinoplanes deccanensis]|uniref:CHAT domain-containing protein n=1 Tax=Paractinoplanes deccanensis TaxID=113561 RepID=A0ABQ3Y6H7_9ACTN|nr:CHAT domain-containing protein [Actinoplanes deccanensis]GID75591.1 hypothetical protein Ade02nite_42320 [Actinoplanes deccanensis]
MDGNIARLRDELSRLDGPARVPKLVELGQALNQRYWRAGPGQPAALGELSAAIEAWDEAYGLLDPGDPARGQVAAQLGWYLSMRYGAHGSGPKDRDTAIFVLREALTFTSVPAPQVTIARLSLGQLHLSRATEAMSPAGARGGFLHGLPQGVDGDADEAVRLFREVLDGPPLSADVTAMARTLLTLAESIQPLLSGDLSRLDLGKMMEMMSVLQRLQRDGMPSTTWVTGDSLNYPVTVMDPEVHQPPTVPPRRPAPTAFAAPSSSARRAARDRLSSLVACPDQPVWEQARALLLAGPSAVPPADLDAFAGAAANAADEDEGTAVERGLDRLLAAIGMSLRGRRDGSGWADEEDVPAAYVAAAHQLAAATRHVPPDHPAAVVIIEATGSVLDDRRPLAGPVTDIAQDISSYGERVPSLPPAAAAVAALCRAVAAAEIVPCTAAGVPAGHPWHQVLTTAAAHAELLAAVRAGAPVPPRPELGFLAMLLHDVPAALDAAPKRPSPREAAVLGAAHPDPDTAISLLESAVRALDDDGLRTRTWQRLAEAYHRRGATGDAELCRNAGLKALRDRAFATRFAHWMIAGGRAAEAFTAFEAAATSPVAASLPHDIVAVLTGVEPPPSPPLDAPSIADVAAAVRRLGAAAFVHVHPAGALRLDAATEELALLPSVPGETVFASLTDGVDHLTPAAATVVSLVPSAAHLLRPLATPTGRPLFVVNPRGDRDAAMAEVLAVRRLFYPQSLCAGRALEPVDTPGTAGDLRVHLPGASLVHLACGLHGTELELADGETLDLASLQASGGLVILAEGTAPALLDAGFRGVVGWQWPVPSPYAALALFLLHQHLVDERLTPAAAVNAVHRWMLDPDRTLSPLLTGAHLHTVRTTDLTQPSLWAALAYHGR